MASFNKVLLMGNLTRDPEVRYTPGGQAVADLRMAVSRRFRSADGQDREETCYVNVTVWAKQAETCGQYLKKGSPAFVEGRLKFDEWEKDGQKFNRLSVVAERVQFLGGSPRGGQYHDGEPTGAAPATATPAPPERAVPAPAQAQGQDDDNEPLAEDVDNLPF